jgi:hypothetical protein
MRPRPGKNFPHPATIAGQRGKYFHFSPNAPDANTRDLRKKKGRRFRIALSNTPLRG